MTQRRRPLRNAKQRLGFDVVRVGWEPDRLRTLARAGRGQTLRVAAPCNRTCTCGDGIGRLLVFIDVWSPVVLWIHLNLQDVQEGE